MRISVWSSDVCSSDLDRISAVVLDFAHRRDTVFHAQAAQGVVVATAQHDTAAAEAGVFAYFPAAAVTDHGRRPVVEAGAVASLDRAIGGHCARSAERRGGREGDGKGRSRGGE